MSLKNIVFGDRVLLVIIILLSLFSFFPVFSSSSYLSYVIDGSSPLYYLIKQEAAFRKRMLNIEQGFLRDPRPENKKLAKDIKKSYKDNVTKFMREVVGMLKRMK